MLDNNNDLLVDLFTNDIVSSICFNSIQTKRLLPPIHFSSNLSNEMVIMISFVGELLFIDILLH